MIQNWKPESMKTEGNIVLSMKKSNAPISNMTLEISA